jgi:P27 family predicted phage terminase small subunit
MPANVLELKGTNRKGRSEKRNEIDIIKPVKKVPNPPNYLQVLAKKEWNRVAPILVEAGLLSEVDLNILAGYCHAFERWILAQKELDAFLIEHGSAVYVTDKGYMTMHPLMYEVRAWKKEMKEFASHFGLSPSTRGNTKPDSGKDKSNKENPFAKFIK